MTEVLVAELFLGYLPSDWLKERPQVQLDQMKLTCWAILLFSVTMLKKKKELSLLKEQGQY